MPPVGGKKKRKNGNGAHSTDLTGDDKAVAAGADVVADVPLLGSFNAAESKVDFADVKGKVQEFSSRLRELWQFARDGPILSEDFVDFTQCVDGFGVLVMELMEENGRLRGMLSVSTSGEYVRKISEAAVSAVMKAVAPLRAAATPVAATAVVSTGAPVVKTAAVPVVSGPNVGMSMPKPVETWSVVVHGKKGGTSKEVIDKVVKEVAPSMGVRVHEIKPIRDGGAVIRTPTAAEREKLAKNEKFEEAGLDVEINERPTVKLVVSGVEAHISVDDFMNELYEKNLKEFATFEVFRKQVWLKKAWKFDPNAQINVVLEGFPEMMGHLVDADRVYIKWYCFKVRMPDSVPHCFRCLGFDHRIRECRMKEDVCRRCGKGGHKASNCTDAPYCRNCAYRGLPAEHSMLSYACPKYAALVARANARH